MPYGRVEQGEEHGGSRRVAEDGAFAFANLKIGITDAPNRYVNNFFRKRFLYFCLLLQIFTNFTL